MSEIGTPKKGLTTNRLPISLPTFQPEICFTIESPSRTVIGRSLILFGVFHLRLVCYGGIWIEAGLICFFFAIFSFWGLLLILELSIVSLLQSFVKSIVSP